MLSADPRPVLTPRLAAHQIPQAAVVLVAGGAPGQVRAHPRHAGIGVSSAQLELDVAVELFEALLAGQLGRIRPEQQPEALGVCRFARHLILLRAPRRHRPRTSARPRPDGREASCARRESSCKGPRGSSPARSARTSMGTPSSATATSTSRWWGDSSDSSAWPIEPSTSRLSALSAGSRPRRRRAFQRSASSGISRPCQPGGAASPRPRAGRTCTPTS